MRLWLAQKLRRIADWLDPQPAAALTHVPALLDLARRLVREQDDRWPDRSGEAKRHQVLAQLIDAFPATSKRLLSRAIEDAL